MQTSKMDYFHPDSGGLVAVNNAGAATTTPKSHQYQVDEYEEQEEEENSDDQYEEDSDDDEDADATYSLSPPPKKRKVNTNYNGNHTVNKGSFKKPSMPPFQKLPVPGKSFESVLKNLKAYVGAGGKISDALAPFISSVPSRRMINNTNKRPSNTDPLKNYPHLSSSITITKVKPTSPETLASLQERLAKTGTSVVNLKPKRGLNMNNRKRNMVPNCYNNRMIAKMSKPNVIRNQNYKPNGKSGIAYFKPGTKVNLPSSSVVVEFKGARNNMNVNRSRNFMNMPAGKNYNNIKKPPYVRPPINKRPTNDPPEVILLDDDDDEEEEKCVSENLPLQPECVLNESSTTDLSDNLNEVDQAMDAMISALNKSCNSNSDENEDKNIVNKNEEDNSTETKTQNTSEDAQNSTDDKCKDSVTENSPTLSRKQCPKLVLHITFKTTDFKRKFKGGGNIERIFF